MCSAPRGRPVVVSDPKLIPPRVTPVVERTSGARRRSSVAAVGLPGTRTATVSACAIESLINTTWMRPPCAFVAQVRSAPVRPVADVADAIPGALPD